MKIKDNEYYEKLYVRLLKAYDLKRNNHNQVEWYNTYKKLIDIHTIVIRHYYINTFLIKMKTLMISVSSLIQKKNF